MVIGIQSTGEAAGDSAKLRMTGGGEARVSVCREILLNFIEKYYHGESSGLLLKSLENLDLPINVADALIESLKEKGLQVAEVDHPCSFTIVGNSFST